MELSRNAVISHSALRLSSPDDLNASESANFSNAANETPASSISLMVANIFFSRRYKYFYVFFPYSFYLPEAKSQPTLQLSRKKLRFFTGLILFKFRKGDYRFFTGKWF